MNNRSITPLPPADFTPEMGNYRILHPFRYWCQKVLPLVYDDSLSYYELLCKVVDYLNKTMEDVDIIHMDVTNLLNAYNQLQNYVNNYFSSLDVQTEINNKLDNMASDGTLYDIIKKYTDPIVNEQNSKIHVLEQRMDEFTSLPDGSTSGDAELADIRVPAPNFNNGDSYPTAGDAVRGQVETLYNEKAEKLIYKKYETGSEQNSYYDFNFKIGNNYLIKNNSETSSCNISSIKSKSDRVIVENIATNLQADNVTFFTPGKEAKGLYIYTSGKSLIEIYNLTIIREYNETLGVYDVFDVTLYGVKPENDDNSDALINLFDIIPSNINVKLYFPKGYYNFNKKSERIKLPEKCSFIGDNAEIHFNDTETEGVSLFEPGSKLLKLEGITFSSTFNSIKNGNKKAYLVYSENTDTIIVKNCNFMYFRTICINANNCRCAIIDGNTFSYMGRDCIRLLNTKSSITKNNVFDHCGDDVVAFTQVEQTVFSDCGHVFYNNRLSYSMGVCYLGCSNVKIYNNKFIRYMYIGKFGKSTELESEGGVSYNIEIENNLFQNPIYCHGIGQGRFCGRISYVRDMIIHDNTFLKNETIANVENIVFIEKWYENVNCDNYLTILACPDDTNERITLEKNYFNDTFDSKTNTRLITGNVPKWLNLIGNFFTQLKAIPLNIPYKTGKVIDNYFGFSVSSISQAFLGNPTINKRNIYIGIAGYSGDNENTVLSESGTTVSPNLNNIKINSNLVAEGYKKSKSLTIPTEGYYFKGDIVYNISNENNVFCWKRLTDGNSHVLGVDWKEIRYN